MDLLPPVDPIPVRPLAYPIRASSERLAERVRASATDASPRADHECDARRCGLVLRAGRRETDRLRRPLEHPPRLDVFEPSAPGPEPAPHPAASPPAERKSYASDPIGKPPEPREELPPDEAPPVQVLLFDHITHVGAVLDVLA